MPVQGARLNVAVRVLASGAKAASMRVHAEQRYVTQSSSGSRTVADATALLADRNACI